MHGGSCRRQARGGHGTRALQAHPQVPLSNRNGFVSEKPEQGCLSCVDFTYKNRSLSSQISYHPHPALSLPCWKWSSLYKGLGRDRPGSDSTPQPSSPSPASSCFLGKACSLVYSCLVTQSCLALCDPMDCNTPGFSVLQLSPRVCSNSCLLSW